MTYGLTLGFSSPLSGELSIRDSINWVFLVDFLFLVGSFAALFGIRECLPVLPFMAICEAVC